MYLNDLISIIKVNEILVILFYAGPDQIIPLVSIIGAIIGFLLIWWRRFVLLVRKVWMRLFKRAQVATKK